jgi:hypothetical protein
MVAVSEHARAERSRSARAERSRSARAERSRSIRSTPPLCGTCCGECICHLQVERPTPRQGIFRRIREDVQTVFAKDPAARGLLEVLTCYPGLHAIWLYRIAHALWRRNLLNRE